MRKSKAPRAAKTYEAHLYVRASIRKRFKISATSVGGMIADVLRLAQTLTPQDFRESLHPANVDEIMDHGYEGGILIDNASPVGKQRRIVFSLGAGLAVHSRPRSLEIHLPATLKEELVEMVRANASNALAVLEPRR